ncbi:MAG: excinuclease ABC subunit UvrC [Elusimicrobiota bacterium]
MDAPSRRHIPHACGVYIMRDAASSVLYIGKAKDLAKRVAQYFNPRRPDLKTRLLAPLIRSIDYVPCASEREALLWERRLIRRHQPFFNSMWKDDKSYPLIALTMAEDFPRLRVVRSKRRDGTLYFGPYPKVSPVRSLLRSLWKGKIFPLRPCDWVFPIDDKKIRSCLYYHTGECPAPCAGKISREDYRRIAQDAALFFQGRSRLLAQRLEREMRAASRRLEFERASRLRDNLSALHHMAERVRVREVMPGRVATALSSSRAVSDLQEALDLPKPPHAIECFDISHLFGRETVASMVRFVGGEPDREQYRKFRVRTVQGVDDTASMAEVVGRRYRRLQRDDVPFPDLVLLDGGKGQLHAAELALSSLGIALPLASLAKQEEEVFLPERAEPVRLDRSRPALRLLQRLRDEAHRFAISYHRLRRKREMFHGETIR